MMDAARTLVSLQHVGVHVRVGTQRVHALENVSLSVRAGDRVGVMGASGAGKSTLLQVMCRLTDPSTGRVETAAGETMPSLVFQFPENQLFSETVAADVGYGLRQGGVPVSEVTTRVHRALEAVGLSANGFAERVPFQLSGGERRRVALAGALAQRRSLVLFDEPTLGLDAQGVAHLQEVLDTLRRDGIAYWIASHDADFVAAVCDRLVVLEAGRVVYEGDPWPLWRDAARCEALGVLPPLRTRLGDALEELGCTGLPPHPDENELVAAMRRLAGAAPEGG